MKTIIAVLAFLLLCCGTGVANAQATRTWVSGVGDDANPCSRTAPCKTFAGAISKTATAGEINCIDAGAFGTVTITKSIAIVCDGQEAGVLASNTNGIIVNAAGAVVLLSGLDIAGAGSGLTGISFLQGASLRVQNTTVRGFGGSPGIGISIAPSSGTTQFEIYNSVVSDNVGTGIIHRPTGSGTVFGVLDGVRSARNGGDGIAVIGVVTSGAVSVQVTRSVAAYNTASGIVAFSAGAGTRALVSDSTAFRNNNGVAANGAGAIVRFTRSVVTSNTTGSLQVAPGSVTSYGTNSIDGNTSDGTFSTTPQE